MKVLLGPQRENKQKVKSRTGMKQRSHLVKIHFLFAILDALSSYVTLTIRDTPVHLNNLTVVITALLYPPFCEICEQANPAFTLTWECSHFIPRSLFLELVLQQKQSK